MKGTDVLGVLAHAGARSGARRFLFLIFFLSQEAWRSGTPEAFFSS